MFHALAERPRPVGLDSGRRVAGLLRHPLYDGTCLARARRLRVTVIYRVGARFAYLSANRGYPAGVQSRAPARSPRALGTPARPAFARPRARAVFGACRCGSISRGGMRGARVVARALVQRRRRAARSRSSSECADPDWLDELGLVDSRALSARALDRRDPLRADGAIARGPHRTGMFSRRSSTATRSRRRPGGPSRRAGRASCRS